MKIAGAISKQISVSASVCACFWVPECVCPEEKLLLCLTRQTVWADTVRGHHSRRTHLASEGCLALNLLFYTTLKIFLFCFFSFVQSLLLFIVCQRTSISALSTVMKVNSEIPRHHKPILFCNCDNMFPTEANKYNTPLSQLPYDVKFYTFSISNVTVDDCHFR